MFHGKKIKYRTTAIKQSVSHQISLKVAAIIYIIFDGTYCKWLIVAVCAKHRMCEHREVFIERTMKNEYGKLNIVTVNEQRFTYFREKEELTQKKQKQLLNISDEKFIT